MKNKKMIFAIIILIIIIGSGNMIVKNMKQSIEDYYYNEAIYKLTEVFFEINGMPLIEEISEFEISAARVYTLEEEIKSLETNSNTKSGERIIETLFEDAYDVISLYEKKLRYSEEISMNQIFDGINSVQEAYLEFGKEMDKKGIKIDSDKMEQYLMELIE